MSIEDLQKRLQRFDIVDGQVVLKSDGMCCHSAEVDVLEDKLMGYQLHETTGGVGPSRKLLLVCLMEEAGEVVLAASKCLRFGDLGTYENGVYNSVALAEEMGDVLGVMDAVIASIKDPNTKEFTNIVMTQRRAEKLDRIKKSMKNRGNL